MIWFDAITGKKVFVHREDIMLVEITLTNSQQHAILILKDSQGRFGIGGNVSVDRLVEQLLAK